MVRTLVFVFMMGLGHFAYSDEPTQQRLLAAQLVRLFDFASLYDSAFRECEKPAVATSDAVSVFQSNPAFFGGISPQSAYWPEIEEIYVNYRLRVCRYMSSEKLVEFLTDRYAESMSVEDLRLTVDFFSTTPGRKYQQASLKLNGELQAYAQRQMRTATASAFEDVSREIAAVVKKYKSMPK